MEEIGDENQKKETSKKRLKKQKQTEKRKSLTGKGMISISTNQLLFISEP
jgi:hypothetical protein